MKKNLSLIVLLILQFSVLLFSQDEMICPVVSVNEKAQTAQVGGIFKPSQNAPGQFFRIRQIIFHLRHILSGSQSAFPYTQLIAFRSRFVHRSICG